jgi:hypothetical protein
MDVGLRQATPHPEVLPFSSRHACYQRPGRVHLGALIPHPAPWSNWTLVGLLIAPLADERPDRETASSVNPGALVPRKIRSIDNLALKEHPPAEDGVVSSRSLEVSTHPPLHIGLSFTSQPAKLSTVTLSSVPTAVDTERTIIPAETDSTSSAGQAFSRRQMRYPHVHHTNIIRPSTYQKDRFQPPRTSARTRHVHSRCRNLDAHGSLTRIRYTGELHRHPCSHNPRYFSTTTLIFGGHGSGRR